MHMISTTPKIVSPQPRMAPWQCSGLGPERDSPGFAPRAGFFGDLKASIAANRLDPCSRGETLSHLHLGKSWRNPSEASGNTGAGALTHAGATYSTLFNFFINDLDEELVYPQQVC